MNSSALKVQELVYPFSPPSRCCNQCLLLFPFASRAGATRSARFHTDIQNVADAICFLAWLLRRNSRDCIVFTSHF